MGCEEGLNTVPFFLGLGKDGDIDHVGNINNDGTAAANVDDANKDDEDARHSDDEQTMIIIIILIIIIIIIIIIMTMIPTIIWWWLWYTPHYSFFPLEKKKKRKTACHDSIRQGTSAVCGHREWFRELVRRLGSTGEINPRDTPLKPTASLPMKIDGWKMTFHFGAHTP